MAKLRFLPVLVLGLTLLVTSAQSWGSAFVRGAYYRLGDADPGAAEGAIGNSMTLDSFSDGLHLSRTGSPHYSSDVPPMGPWDTKLSMRFANEGLGGPAFPGLYSRATSLPMVEQGYALEAWVKAGPTNLDSISNWLIAYNGTPEFNGFGLFLEGSDYVAKIGSFERKLGPADVGVWHHLAYVQALGTNSYFYDGKLVGESTADPIPITAEGGFWLGGHSPFGFDPITHGFNGWIDEVRYQTFNPMAAGAFDPTAFLITVPEPTSAGMLGAIMAVALLRGNRRAHRRCG